MKTKYERMSKEEKKHVYEVYKKEKVELAKKFRNMFILCDFGLIYGFSLFFYDLFIKKSVINYILDIVVFVFCLISLLVINKIKKDLLNKFVLENKKRF